MDFDKIKDNVLSSSETSSSESENISGSELHEEFEIENFLPEFEPLKLSGKNLAQQYVSAFNTGMNIYQCLNYLQGYVYTLVTAMNETIEAWNTVVPLLEQATKEWTDEEFDYKWSILKPQVIELVTNLTIETFNKSWEELKPQVIKLAQDTTDAEFNKQWNILKPQVIELVQTTTAQRFNEEWENLKPTIIQLSTDTTIAQFNKSWTELKPQVIELSQQTTSDKFDEKWTELRPQLIELSQTTTSNKFDEKWTELQPTLTETVNNLAKTQTTTTFNEEWTKLKPQIIELAQTTTSTKFDEKWTELQPTLTETVNNLVNTNLETFKTTLWQEVTKNDSFPFLLPENFGAVGDGTTDDSSAFNACINKATQTGKYIFLSNKAYSIQNTLIDISNINFIGVKSVLLLTDIVLFNNVELCSFNNINFICMTSSSSSLFNNFNSSVLRNCTINDVSHLFSNVSLSVNYHHSIINNCSLENTGLCYSNSFINDTIIINNTIFNYDSNFESYILSGLLGGTIIFNQCEINSVSKTELIRLLGNIIFNDCRISVDVIPTLISIENNTGVNDLNIEFNSCTIANNDNLLVDVKAQHNILPSVKIKNTSISTGVILNANIESSLWLENNQMDTKPIINSGTGKVNLVEIQQKYSANSSNVFPWISEIPSRYENNVKLIKPNNTEYYVLTENKYTNVKKLDYYFNYNLNYLPNAPYYNNNIIVSGLGLKGYTAKKALLNNELCKLKNDNGELIDYVYMMLDECTVNTVETTLAEETTITMKFLPYFAKLKTDTPVSGQCEVNMCISIILEKTSS